MFESEAYRSYIALCRELRLERKVKEGDWLTSRWKSRSGWSEWSDLGMCNDDGGGCHNANFWETEDQGEEIVWLPRLDQWLAMLEEAGVDSITIHRMPGYGYRVAWDAPNGYACTYSTREEAAARLWMAVRKPVAA